MGLRGKFLGGRGAACAIAAAAALLAVSGFTTSSATAAAVPTEHPSTDLTAPVAGQAEGHRTSTSSLDGISVTLTVRPWRANPGALVHFALSVTDSHANGALGYVLKFGDGSSGSPVMPMYCLAVGRAAHATWQLTHRYSSAGHYKTTATAFSNCGGGRVTTTVDVRIL